MERRIIELFMWGYQDHVQISFQVSAELLFKKIDTHLNPKVFFVGVLQESRDDRHPICLEPEDCGFLPECFKDVKQIAGELEKLDGENNIFHSHPIAQESHEKRITTKSYIDALLKLLNRYDAYGDNKYFVGFPTLVEGYQVFTVLSLKKEVIAKYYTLTKDKFRDRYTIFRSLIESAVSVFLKECTIALKDPTNTTFPERSAEEMLRSSGKELMYAVAVAGGNLSGIHTLYNACNEIASMKYEGAIGIGGMIIASPGHQNIKYVLKLKNPIEITNYRMVRKFLEVSDNNTSLVSDAASIYGLGELRGTYNPVEQSLFVVNFTSHFKWELLHNNNPLMEVEYRMPSIPKEKINRDKFYADFPRIFKEITNEQINDLWDIAIVATKQKHGTMLVISENAAGEAERLGKQSLAVNPFKLTERIIPQISSIDGSVLLDRNATCYAIGVILDGLATDKGDASRGARYNSAIRYYEHFGKQYPTVIVIISEDGMINLIPDLMPQIEHSVIGEAIEEFRSILKHEKLKHKDFNLGMSFFQSIKFYLSQEECDTINQLRKEIEAKFSKELIWMRIVYNDLKPNPEMNESYFKD